ncbi:biotin synthase BioB [Actinokineospora inagensis]|uniref:biotin synthase BioB n=1 Tax=Actinokineospora inagensis TaxID=103730 RepID=UPI0004160DBB|nr:biotin synthase BioB [Actinokineospora inagensis]
MDSADLFAALARKALDREPLTRDEALAVLRAPDSDVLELVAAGSRVRRRFFGNRVKVNYLVNLKSGLCPEDCGYCSQRLGSTADILRYTWLKPEAAVAAAEAGIARGAKRVCLVGSGRGPSDADVGRVADTIARLKGRHPDVEVCACFGLLTGDQAAGIRAAGADAYNHNLNTADARYADICSTHTYTDRVDTIEHAKSAGLSACSGLIVGMGESDDEVVDVLFALRDLDVDSVPVNFLIPIKGTPLDERWSLTPQRCLKVLALARLAHPDVEVRVAGGREIHLRSLQPLALHLANSLFLGDYLTSEGQDGDLDLKMIADLGFVVEGTDESTLPRERPDLVRSRKRGAGTDLPANA